MRLSLFQGLRPIRLRGAVRDALAGVVLASISIPQALGYTRIAGTPIVTGLYTVLAPLLAFATFGSSRHLVVGADSATAAIFANGLSGMAPRGSAKYMALVGTVALITALFLLLARVFKLGFLADFLSRTVLVGFLTGVGFQIGIAMLSDMLGLAVTSHRTVDQLQDVVRSLPKTHLPTLIVSVLVVFGILSFRGDRTRMPVPLIAVIAGIAASFIWDLAGHGIAVIGLVPGGLPVLSWPETSWKEALQLVPVAVSCFVIVIAQSAATARVFALRHGERVDEDADILGLSAANVAAAVTGAFVVNGSPTQTAMADRVGARSQFAQVVFAVVVGIVLLCLTAPLKYLPRCVLAGIVFTIAVGLVDLRGLRDIRRESPGEFVLAIMTACVVAFVGLETGVLLAATLSLLRHVRHSYRPHTMMFTAGVGGHWSRVPATPGTITEPGLIVYQFGADLFYANDSRFVAEVLALVDRAPTPVRWFVIDASAMTDVDYSAARSVRSLCTDLRHRGVKLVFARVAPYLRADLDRHRITAAVGESCVFETLHQAIAAVRTGEAAAPKAEA
jgi:sulfate permease, SulP family